jgi:riboflavin kinase/FMN adenylyltransferase
VRQVRIGGGARVGWPSPAVAIGNFDGVHVGHRALLEATVRWARQHQGTAAALTFDPHPARVLAPERAPAALSTAAQKAELLGGLGLDAIAVLPFSLEVARLEPEEFVRRILVAELGIQWVVVGEGFRFGRAQAGTVGRLEALGRELGFGVEAIAPVLLEGQPVSSSRVRDALAVGDVALARALLGRSYFVDGSVVRGDQRGRTLGFPTANLALANELLPSRGVYAGRLRGPDGVWRPAVVNRGTRPTFGGEGETVEAHVLDFEGDLYGAGVRLAFEERLRGELRFSGAAALVAQIELDVARARALVSSRGAV